MSPEFLRAEIAQTLMKPFLVVKPDPLINLSLRFSKVLEPFQPHALLLDRPKKSLDQPILLRAVGRDEFLSQTVLFTGPSESFGRRGSFEAGFR